MFGYAKFKYVQKMEVYYGACHEDVEFAIGYKIVYGLMDGYKNKPYIVLGSFKSWGACHKDLQNWLESVA